MEKKKRLTSPSLLGIRLIRVHRRDAAMAQPGDLIGSRISLISNKDLRYEGILFNINAEESSVTLKSGELPLHNGHYCMPVIVCTTLEKIPHSLTTWSSVS